MFRFKRDPLGDPVVMAWDAYVAGDPAASARSSQQTFTLIETLNSGMADIEPDADFLASLERKLLGFNAQPMTAVATPVGAASRPVPPSEPPVLRRFAVARQPGYFAIAALLAIFLAGAAVLAWSKQDDPDGPQRIPAAIDSAATDFSVEATPAPEAPGSQDLLNLTIDPRALGASPPSTWTELLFSEVHIRSGEAVSTSDPYFAGVDGINVVMVMQGSLTLDLSGPIDVVRAGDSSPERFEAGTSVTVNSGDQAVFAMESTGELASTGSDDLVMLNGIANMFTQSTIQAFVPDAYEEPFSVLDNTIAPIDSDIVSVQFSKVSVQPGESTHFEFGTDERGAFYSSPLSLSPEWFVGRLNDIQESESGTTIGHGELDDFGPGAYTMHNPHDEELTVYLMRLTVPESTGGLPAASPEASPRSGSADISFQPVSSASPFASPVAESQPAETLLDIQVNPAELGATTFDLWDTLEFALVHVNPGESFSTDHPYFTCCAGVAVFQVQDGSASFVVESDADVYTADSGLTPVRVPAGTLFALESGDTAVFAMDEPAIVTNNGSEELLMLGAYGYQFVGPMTSVTPDGYLDQPWVAGSDMDPLPGDEVQVQLERIALEPGELTHIESSPESPLVGWYPETNTVVRMAKGAINALPDDPLGTSMVQSFVMTNFAEGPYTFFNVGHNNANLFLMRVTSVAAQSGTPSPVASAVATSVASPFAETQTAETLLDIQVNPAELNATKSDLWDTMEFEMVYVNAGESFSTDHPYFTCCAGITVFQILEGSASFVVESDADVYASGEWSTPTRIPAGTLFALGPGESAVFVMDEPAIVTNTGTEELVMLRGSGEQFVGPITSQMPDGYQGGAWATDSNMKPIPGETVNVSFERVALEPGAITHVESTAGVPLNGLFPETDTTLHMLVGAFDAIPADDKGFLVGSIVMGNFSPGPYTFYNSGDRPATLYLMRIEEVAPVSPAASPVAVEPAAVASPEDSASGMGEETSATSQQLVSVLANPAAFSIGDPDTWTDAAFELGYLKPGESVETAQNDQICCHAGLAVLHVLDGTLEIELDGPAQIAESIADANPSVVELSGTTTLEAGNTIWYSLESQPVISNPGESQLSFLSMFAYVDAGGEDEESQDSSIAPQTIGSSYSAPGIDLAAGTVSASFDRVDLGPGASLPLQNIEGEPAMALLVDGPIDYYQDTGAGRPDDPAKISTLNAGESISFDGLAPGTWFVENLQDTPATLYVGRLTSDLPATIDESGYTSVASAIVKPSVHSFGANPGWNETYFAEATLEPFASESSTDPAFGCCDGVHLITVLEGELTVQMNLPIMVGMQTGDGQGPMNPVVLHAGDFAMYEGDMVATNNGSESARFLIGGAYRSEPTTETTDLDRGFSLVSRVTSSFEHDPDDLLQRIGIDQVTIAPGQSVPLTVTPDDAQTLLAEGGSVLLLSDEDNWDPVEITDVFSGDMLEPGEYVLSNTGSSEVTVYTLRIGPDLAPPSP